MPDQEKTEDEPFLTRMGPIDVNWPRTIGFYGGLAIAFAFDLLAPELVLFVAAVPLVKLLKRKHATRPEKFSAEVIEGAAQPLGGDAKATVRPAWLDDEEAGTRGASSKAHGRQG